MNSDVTGHQLLLIRGVPNYMNAVVLRSCILSAVAVAASGGVYGD